MRNKRFRIQTAVWLVAVAWLLPTACVERTLEIRPAVDDRNVRIDLDWGTLPAPPQTVHYLFYNESGTLAHEATQIAASFTGQLPPGKYRLIVHNEDARQVGFRGMEAYHTAEVFALPLPGSHKAIGNARTLREEMLPCILEPQSVYATGVCSQGEWITVQPGALTHTTVCPLLLTHELQFRFVVKGNIETASLTGVLGGIAPGLFLATGKVSNAEVCAIRFSASPADEARSEGDKLFTAHLNVFNLLTGTDSPPGTNVIDALLTDTDGRQYPTTVDITHALKDIIEGNHGEIPVEIPIEVRFEVGEIGDITSSVGSWENGGTGEGKPGWE